MNKLTIRHLKQNKRRTLVTIIGVIISVAMLTAVTTISVSFLDLLKRQTIADEGEWHVIYKDVDQNQLETIKNDDTTKTVVLSNDRGYAPLEESQNDNKPYLFIKEYNSAGFEQFPIELSEGRFPQKVDEVVISEAIIDNAKVNYKIGDTLTLQVGDRYLENDEDPLQQHDSFQTDHGEIAESLKIEETRIYTIVGTMKRPTWEPTWAPGYTIISYIDENAITEDQTVNASVVLKKVNKSLFTLTEEFATANNIQSFDFNHNLLRYYGVIKNDHVRNTLMSLSAIIMTVIIVGSVSLIYNAFAISVSERSRHLGMLSSVGATKRQKRNSVFFEGMIIGLISIPFGMIGGLTGIGITFLYINTILEGALGGSVTEKLTVTVTPISIIVACGVSLLTIFISTYLPAKRASRVSAIDAIRQTMDVKLTTKAVKTSKFIRKLFGMEAEIGLKNLKRNKRRYQATVFSLVISIVLFLSVSFFTDNLKRSLALTQDGINYDIVIGMGSQSEETWDRFVQSMDTLDNVTEYSVITELNLTSWIDKEFIADELEAFAEELLKDGKYPYYVNITALDGTRLQAYAKEIGVNVGQLEGSSEHLPAIIIDTIPYEDQDAGKYVETKAIHTKVGKSLELLSTDWETDEETYVNQVEIVALTDQFPMGIQVAGIGGLNVIVSENTLEWLSKNISHHETYSKIYLKSSDPMATQQQIEDMKEVNLHMYNVYQHRQQEEQMILIMSVFTYGFILLISAISIANIFNTISTSISLRKREFAMLKSVGMTPKGFNKMINYESVFYGIKSLLYGLPLSIAVMYWIHKALMNSFSYRFELPFISIIYVIVAVFVIVGSAMIYSSAKIKKENIIEALKQENI